MQIIRGSQLNKIKLPPLALTIGNFDGVHFAHQKIINTVKKIAKEENLKSALVTFEPHPDCFFNKNLKENFRIQSLAQKLRVLQNQSLDFLIIIPFTINFSNSLAQDFIKKYLVESLNLKHLVIGYDFSFGKNRQGNVALLEEKAKEFDYKISKISALEIDSEICSSSKIRQLIKGGKIKEANALLGRNFSICGDVVFGKKIARQIGFPTANVKARKQIIMPKFGAYKALVNFKNSKEKLLAIVNFGVKPTLFDEKEPIFEVHIFDFNQEIYGKKIEIELVDFIREEKKFESVDALKKQIEEDCKKVLNSEQMDPAYQVRGDNLGKDSPDTVTTHLLLTSIV